MNVIESEKGRESARARTRERAREGNLIAFGVSSTRVFIGASPVGGDREMAGESGGGKAKMNQIHKHVILAREGK